MTPPRREDRRAPAFARRSKIETALLSTPPTPARPRAARATQARRGCPDDRAGGAPLRRRQAQALRWRWRAASCGADDMIPWLDRDDLFPPVNRALPVPNGLLCAGADLSPERLIEAYRRGIFP